MAEANRTIGWDIGGAHLKAALIEDGRVVKVMQRPCALWQGTGHLDRAFGEMLCEIGSGGDHAVTMTGELVDLFASRAEGVGRIVECAAGHLGSRLAVYAGPRGFVAPDRAGRHVEDIAAANWHATAALAAGRLDAGVLIDIGSTTSDIIPFSAGAVRARGYDDTARLMARELVYSAIIRTPVMAVAPDAAFRGEPVPLMAELFATMADVYRITGELDEASDQSATADGRGKSVAHSRARLARMIGRNAGDAPADVWEAMACDLRAAQLAKLEQALRTVLAREPSCAAGTVVSAGVGGFLVRELARCAGMDVVAFAVLVDAADGTAAWAEACAPAVAVALLHDGLHST